jgi:hypothetical protein
MQLLIRVRVGTRAVTDLRASLPIAGAMRCWVCAAEGSIPISKMMARKNQAHPRATRRVLRGG